MVDDEALLQASIAYRKHKPCYTSFRWYILERNRRQWDGCSIEKLYILDSFNLIRALKVYIYLLTLQWSVMKNKFYFANIGIGLSSSQIKRNLSKQIQIKMNWIIWIGIINTRIQSCRHELPVKLTLVLKFAPFLYC